MDVGMVSFDYSHLLAAVGVWYSVDPPLATDCNQT